MEFVEGVLVKSRIQQRSANVLPDGWSKGVVKMSDTLRVGTYGIMDEHLNPLSTDGTKFFDGFSVGLAAGMPLGTGFRKSVKVANSVAVIFGSHLQNGMSVTRKIHCPVFCRWSKGEGD